MIKKHEGPKLILLVALLAGFCILLRPVQRVFLARSFPQGYASLVEDASRETGVAPSLIYAVIRTESHFRPDVTSYAGAVGLMQLTPDTFDWLQSIAPEGEHIPPSGLIDPEINIRYGTKFLRRLFDEFEDPQVALSAYHAGRGNVQKWLADQTVVKVITVPGKLVNIVAKEK